jgi:hypothetical protein
MHNNATVAIKAREQANRVECIVKANAGSGDDSVSDNDFARRRAPRQYAPSLNSAADFPFGGISGATVGIK